MSGSYSCKLIGRYFIFTSLNKWVQKPIETLFGRFLSILETSFYVCSREHYSSRYTNYVGKNTTPRWKCFKNVLQHLHFFRKAVTFSLVTLKGQIKCVYFFKHYLVEHTAESYLSSQRRSPDLIPCLLVKEERVTHVQVQQLF